MMKDDALLFEGRGGGVGGKRRKWELGEKGMGTGISVFWK